MKKKIKNKLLLKLNKQTIANLTNKELNSLKGGDARGTQLDTIQEDEVGITNPPPPSNNCNSTNECDHTNICHHPTIFIKTQLPNIE